MICKDIINVSPFSYALPVSFYFLPSFFLGEGKWAWRVFTCASYLLHDQGLT